MSKKKTKRTISISDRNIGVLQKSKAIATVYIGNLRYDLGEAQIKKMFERYGEVTYVRLMMDIKTQKSKGFAFVQMPDKQKANNAITSMNGHEINGRTLKVSIAKDSETLTENKAAFRPPESSFKEDAKNEIVEKKKPSRRKKSSGLAELFAYKNSIRASSKI